MKLTNTYFIKILFWVSLLGFLSCGSFPPRDGVFTEITKLKFSATGFGSNDGYFHGTMVNNTLTQTLAQAKDYALNHGGIVIGGDFTVYLASYCCFNGAHGWYLKMFKRDNISANNQITYEKQVPSEILHRVDDFLFSFKPTFDDPTISMPESHVYTIEFWECLGECKPDEYNKKTDKKGEIVINYSVTP